MREVAKYTKCAKCVHWVNLVHCQTPARVAYLQSRGREAAGEDLAHHHHGYAAEGGVAALGKEHQPAAVVLGGTVCSRDWDVHCIQMRATNNKFSGVQDACAGQEDAY